MFFLLRPAYQSTIYTQGAVLKVLSDALHIVLSILLVGQLYNWSYSNILLLRVGDISPNPSPFKNGLRFFH